MPAPKGNKFAAKTEVKSKPFGIRLSSRAKTVLDNIMKEKSLTASDVFEKLLVEEEKRQKTKK